LKTNKYIPFNKLENWRALAGTYRVVATNGCFDILHAGHVHYLQEAKKKGHILIVGINSDRSVKQVKGNDRPINSQIDRAYVLSGLLCVDYVTIFPQKTATRFLEKAKPNVYVKGGDYTLENMNPREVNVLEKCESSILTVDFMDGRSTTDTIKRVKSIRWGRGKRKSKK